MPFTNERIGNRFDKNAFDNVSSIRKIKSWNEESYLEIYQQVANLPVSYGVILDAAIRSQADILVKEIGDSSLSTFNASMLPDLIQACADKEIKPLDPEKSARAYMMKYDNAFLRMGTLIDPLKAHIKALQTEIIDADTSKISVLNLEKQRVLSSAAEIRNPFKRWAYKRREMKAVKKMVDEDFSRIKGEKENMISEYQTIIDKYHKVQTEGYGDGSWKMEFENFAERYGHADSSPRTRAEDTPKTQMNLTSHMPESRQSASQNRGKTHDALNREVSEPKVAGDIVP